MDNPAATAIAIIKDEHRSLAAVVKGMQARVAAVRAGAEALDVHLLRAMLDYIEVLPDRVHHPKEDEVLFRILRRRSGEAARVLDELEAEHVQSRDQREAMRNALDSLDDAAAPGAGPAAGALAALGRRLDAYADFLWNHMRREEDIVLPMAQRSLSEQDWRAVAEAFEANRRATP